MSAKTLSYQSIPLGSKNPNPDSTDINDSKVINLVTSSDSSDSEDLCPYTETQRYSPFSQKETRSAGLDTSLSCLGSLSNRKVR
jgi:hypothetical protein